VVFIETDASIRRALAIHANAQPGFQCAAVFADAAEALRELPGRPADLMLVNHDLPGDAAAARLEELHRLRPNLAVVAYSVFEDSDHLFKSTPGGAMLYMLRRTLPDRMFEPLEGLQETPTRERLASQVSNYFQRWAAQLPSGPPAWKLARLTPREHEILDCLSKGDLLKEIAFKLGISNWTVQGHVKRIFEKLKVHTRTEAVVKYLQK
jgi:DNA-binding NarL/FixJ family response regulator